MKSARILALLLLSALVVTARARGEEPRAIVITAKRFEFVPSTITLKKGRPSSSSSRARTSHTAYFSGP